MNRACSVDQKQHPCWCAESSVCTVPYLIQKPMRGSGRIGLITGELYGIIRTSAADFKNVKQQTVVLVRQGERENGKKLDNIMTEM